MCKLLTNVYYDELMIDGRTVITEQRLRRALENISQESFEIGREYALTNLMTTDQMAASVGVTVRRMQAIVKNRHDRFGVGFQIRGKNPWIFTPEETEILRPGKVGRPKK